MGVTVAALVLSCLIRCAPHGAARPRRLGRRGRPSRSSGALQHGLSGEPLPPASRPLRRRGAFFLNFILPVSSLLPVCSVPLFCLFFLFLHPSHPPASFPPFCHFVQSFYLPACMFSLTFFFSIPFVLWSPVCLPAFYSCSASLLSCSFLASLMSPSRRPLFHVLRLSPAASPAPRVSSSVPLVVSLLLLHRPHSPLPLLLSLCHSSSLPPGAPWPVRCPSL